MSWGFCYLAERSSPSDAIRAIIDSATGQYGLVLRNMHTNKITVLTEEGEQIEVSESELVTRNDSQTTFQLWYSAGEDLLCTVRAFGDGMVSHTYGIEGFTTGQRTTLVRYCLSYFERIAASGEAWLVVDPEGETNDVAWDEVVLGTSRVPWPYPPVVGLPQAQRSRLGHVPPWVSVRECGSSLLIQLLNA